LTIAAIFTTDPITVSANAVTIEGTLHNLGETLGIAMPFAAVLIGWKLARNPVWSSARRPLLWATALALVAFLVSFVSLGVMVSRSGGEFGPDVLVGWPNRIEIVAYSVWLMVVARQAIRVHSRR
jgi:cytochrome bd-type quinol oxidase subunit 1